MMINNQQKLPAGWKWVKLKAVCEINPRRNSSSSISDNAEVTFVPMPAVDAVLGEITKPEIKKYGEVKRGYTYFEEGDILFAKITPCMQNGKHAIATKLLNKFGFGTTEFHVLRPSKEIIPEWIHFYLRKPEVLYEAMQQFTGAVGQQRVPAEFLKELQIPLPPLSEQKRIAKILGEQLKAVEKARTAAQQQLEAAKSLPKSYLREVFESKNTKKWASVSVQDICNKIQYGYTASANLSLNTPKLLRITDIQNGKVNWDSVPGCMITKEDKEKYQLLDGDIVFARTGATTGKSFLIKNPPDSVFASYLIRLSVSDRVNSNFLYTFFQSDGYWKQVYKSARGGAQPNVNANLLGKLIVPLPSKNEQEQIISVLNEQFKKMQKLQSISEGQFNEIDTMPSALLRKAFQGEL